MCRPLEHVRQVADPFDVNRAREPSEASARNQTMTPAILPVASRRRPPSRSTPRPRRRQLLLRRRGRGPSSASIRRPVSRRSCARQTMALFMVLFAGGGPAGSEVAFEGAWWEEGGPADPASRADDGVRRGGITPLGRAAGAAGVHRREHFPLSTLRSSAPGRPPLPATELSPRGPRAPYDGRRWRH